MEKKLPSLPGRRTRHVWKILVWVPVAAALALVVELWIIFGWRVGELSYHESWSPQLRAELQEMDAFLLAEPMRELVIDELCEDGDISLDNDDDEVDEVDGDEDDDDEEDDEEEEDDDEVDDEEVEDCFADGGEMEVETGDESLEELMEDTAERLWREPSFLRLYLHKSIELRLRLARARRNLKETAAKGYQPKEQRYTTAAHLAARLGKAALLRELVERGADPNARNEDEEWRGEDKLIHPSVFCNAIAGLSYADPAPLPVQEKLKLLDYLLSRGADVRGREHEALYAAAIEARGNDFNDEGQTLVWLFTHGITPQSAQDWRLVAFCLMTGDTMRETTRRLIQQGVLNPDKEALPYLLRSLLEHAAWGLDVKDMLLWLLDELHADPNAPLPSEFAPPCTVASSYAARIISLKQFKKVVGSEGIDNVEYLRILLAHGARFTPEEIRAMRPEHEKQQAPFDALFPAAEQSEEAAP